MFICTHSLWNRAFGKAIIYTYSAVPIVSTCLTVRMLDRLSVCQLVWPVSMTIAVISRKLAFTWNRPCSVRMDEMVLGWQHIIPNAQTGSIKIKIFATRTQPFFHPFHLLLQPLMDMTYGRSVVWLVWPGKGLYCGCACVRIMYASLIRHSGIFSWILFIAVILLVNDKIMTQESQ